MNGATKPEPSKPQFRIRLNGMSVPELNVRPDPERAGEWQIAVCLEGLGWMVVDDRPNMVLEFRDETSWALLPVPMRQAFVDKGWCRATPQELIDMLQFTGVID
jgi:hypothetical protein